MKKFAGLICNFVPASCRLDTLEKKEYIVVPMVILTEGVHQGSQGPLYYPQEELSKTPVAWNHKPIVVYHPTVNGTGVSACTPEVINERKIGLMLNTKFEGGKLKSEAWIDTARANEVDERIMLAINEREMMELSTGVFIDVEETAGKWGKEEYGGIARNFRPDHLALLPDQIGACSIDDGAGLLRNAAQRMGKGEAGKAVIAALQKVGLIDNELSFSNIQGSLCAALREKFNIKDNTTGPWPWVSDVYSNFVIYEMDGKLWRLDYTSTDSGVTLGDESPKEVNRVTEYRTVNGAYVGNQKTSTSKNQVMEKKQKVDGIIAANKGWGEADRDALNKLNDAQLDLVANAVKETAKNEPAPAAGTVATAAVVAAPAAAAVTAPAANTVAAPAAAKATTVQDYISQAPPEFRDVLTNGLAAHNAEKTKLVEAILGNAQNSFTKEDLQNKPLAELRSIARLASVPASENAPHYAGQAPVANTTGGEEALGLPTMNFEVADKTKEKAA